MSPIDEILKLFAEKGDSAYGGEPINQREHALQTALLARQNDASPELVAAALLHDIGHLVHDLPADAPERGIDDRHEELGEKWLTDRFVPAVTEPVKLHVSAKRYLCATDEKYHALLSEPSIVSLALQGGSMSEEEIAQFEENAFFREAVALRKWDDEAKVSGLETPPVGGFVEELNAGLKS